MSVEGRNFGAKDCPKNAHLVPDWEDLEEARREAHIEATTSIVDENDMAAMMRMASLAGNDFASQRQSVKVRGSSCHAILCLQNLREA